MRADNLKNAKSIESLLPVYRNNVSEYVISLEGDKLLFTVELAGTAFKSVSDEELYSYFSGLDDFFLNLGKEYGGKLAIWTHIIKKKDTFDQEYQFNSKFITRFTKTYLTAFDSEKHTFFKTNYYITFVLKYEDIYEGLVDCDNIVALASTILHRYEGGVLKVVDISDSVSICENNEFLSYLLNGNKSTITLNDNEVIDSVCNSDWLFNYDFFEVRNRESTKSKFGTAYFLKGYPAETSVGMWDFLLEMPYEFIFSQSFIFTTAQKSIASIERQENKLGSAGDSATHEVEELTLAKAYLSTGEIAFGDYQASILIFGDTPKAAVNNGAKVISSFTDRGKGARWTRATIESMYAFLSVMPASKYRPLNSVRCSTNLVCGFSLHNYFSGKKSGNPIGDGSALMPIKTPTQGLYYFNTHYSPIHENVIGEKIAGHFLVLGATGTGKTTWEAAFVGFVQRFNPQIFVVDYKRSTELYMRAYGASYFTLESGIDTGLNPFQLEEKPSKSLLQFLYRFVGSCAKDYEGNVSDEDLLMIKESVDSVMLLPVEQRRFSMLLQTIPAGTSLHLRLRKWCYQTNGELAWVVDSPVNKFNPLEFNQIGFDTTVILETKDHPATEPLLAILLYYKQVMKEANQGRLMLTIIEEFYMPCNYPTTQDMIKQTLKTGRLTGEFLGLVSQSPADAIQCAIFAAIVEQTSTKIMLPNPMATYDDANIGYKRIGLTPKDFAILKSFDKESRKMLVKQGDSSTELHFDLSHCMEFMPILSGSTEGQAECAKIRAQYGDNPDDWIDPFLERMKELKRQQAAKKITD
ncbi:VirB4 family type IV secretion system protein [Aggregatibacter kilianii]|uniref:VirB4 family type IV secretion/conjugal transfer ATPase n=1 Tax=Aggregatibacter kilianii TaxID=2025884 RepID=UPI000D699EAD|nr:VirB4 family type IV secretion system protein [Aggregatibacter kilianii]